MVSIIGSMLDDSYVMQPFTGVRRRRRRRGGAGQVGDGAGPAGRGVAAPCVMREAIEACRGRLHRPDLSGVAAPAGG